MDKLHKIKLFEDVKAEEENLQHWGKRFPLNAANWRLPKQITDALHSTKGIQFDTHWSWNWVKKCQKKVFWKVELPKHPKEHQRDSKASYCRIRIITMEGMDSSAPRDVHLQSPGHIAPTVLRPEEMYQTLKQLGALHPKKNNTTTAHSQ